MLESFTHRKFPSHFLFADDDVLPWEDLKDFLRLDAILSPFLLSLLVNRMTFDESSTVFLPCQPNRRMIDFSRFSLKTTSTHFHGSRTALKLFLLSFTASAFRGEKFTNWKYARVSLLVLAVVYNKYETNVVIIFLFTAPKTQEEETFKVHSKIMRPTMG
jgi:hypothetical protein